MTTKADLHREYARVIDMCEGTTIYPQDCFKYDNSVYSKNWIGKPTFEGNPDSYRFALGIVEGRPCFYGDTLYNQHGYGPVRQEIFFKLRDTAEWSWSPPKPKTVMVELLESDAKFWLSLHPRLSKAECNQQSIRFYDAIQEALNSEL